MENLIELRRLCKTYDSGEAEVEALHDVDLSIGEGEFVSIVGQSGSGKSTLMNIMGCLDLPSSGSYLLGGVDIAHSTDERLSDIRNRQIGFIFQGFNLIDSLSALENVELPLIYRRLPRAARERLAREALQRVGLSHRMHHRPGQMSGGQQQRVAIARAVAAAPALILADEPTGNLDTQSGEQVIDILRALHEEGRTIVLITHDPGLAGRTGRVIRLRDGHIVSDTARHRSA
ncbi:ABC transporter ATP-binding protein [Harryflintia acetispora]|uniref:ABC transport system ATP-binding protein n=1 Tax=Harryflintia acetispora TaxID=1849041 RepID=A0A9X8UL15_9FIRM|nr:ABC transporter ATP-binding protein [Harryflintia acetispora]TCL45074.1 putative ABC transport system ATP-binding protein [Harryflintia acetispora]